MTTLATIRLDRSRPVAEVHGDRMSDDPLYRVAYYQGGLPFDASGLLVPDDGSTAPKLGLGLDGKEVRYPPLYNDEMRKLVAKRLRKVAAPAAAPVETESEGVQIEDDEDAPASDEINLEMWLRGEARYQPFQIFAECKKRFNRVHTSLRSVVDDLVLDEKLVPESEVAKDLMALLN